MSSEKVTDLETAISRSVWMTARSRWHKAWSLEDHSDMTRILQLGYSVNGSAGSRTDKEAFRKLFVVQNAVS